MDRIHEEKKIDILIVPQSMGAGDTIEGDYKSLVGGAHDVLFHVPFGALAQTKTVTVKVYQADDDGGDGEEELEDAETVYTAPTGGVDSGQVLISIPLDHFSKEFASVKVSNTAAVPLLGYAEMIVDQSVRAADANSQASAVTVL